MHSRSLIDRPTRSDQDKDGTALIKPKPNDGTQASTEFGTEEDPAKKVDNVTTSKPKIGIGTEEESAAAKTTTVSPKGTTETAVLDSTKEQEDEVSARPAAPAARAE